MVSGALSLPSRGAFHLSLTVLVHYRWQRVFSLIEWSRQIHTRFLVSRATWEYDRRPDPFAYQAVTVCGLLFQNSSARIRICNSGVGYTEPTCRSHDPETATPVRYIHRIGLGCSPFARRY